jgi:hypothetical protein
MAQILAFPSPPRHSSVYGKRSIDLYARLLDEEAAGSSAEALARDVLSLDPRDAQAPAVLQWHLTRARRIADTLFWILER